MLGSWFFLLPYVGRFACDWPRLSTTDLSDIIRVTYSDQNCKSNFGQNWGRSSAHYPFTRQEARPINCKSNFGQNWGRSSAHYPFPRQEARPINCKSNFGQN